jgi:hypothetical protein
VHKNGRRHHGFCCNACRKSEVRHTQNCTGQGRTITAVADANNTVSRRPERTAYFDCGLPAVVKFYSIPEDWACTDGEIVGFVQWYMDYVQLHMSPETLEAWKKLETCFWAPSMVDRRRALDIYVLAKKNSPLLRDANTPSVVDVHDRGLDARASTLYNMSDVTGIDFALQAVLVCQTCTPEILIDACREIETGNLFTFTLVCSHATHRSVACAVLLAILAYPNAQICFSTSRTQRAAVDWRMIEHHRATLVPSSSSNSGLHS